VKFWLRELRTPELLIEVARVRPALCRRISVDRPLLRHATADNVADLHRALVEEEIAEREQDRIYWQPLRRELERLRHSS
jgi:hypothetical protein